MKRFALLRCYPSHSKPESSGYSYSCSANECLAECEALNKPEAIKQLQSHCPIPLDKDGYVKQGKNTYTVCAFL